MSTHPSGGATSSTKWGILTAFFGRSKRIVFSALGASVLSQVLTVLILVGVSQYYRLEFGVRSHRAMLLDTISPILWETLPRFFVFFFALVFLKVVVGYAERYYAGVVGETLAFDMQKQLFAHQLGVPMRVYDERGIGRYLLRYSGDLRSIQSYVTRGIIRFVSDSTLVLLVLAVLAVLDYRLLVLLVLFAPLAAGVIVGLNRPLYGLSVKRRDTRSGLLAFVNTRLRSVLTIKSFNKDVPEIGKFTKRAEKLYAVSVRYRSFVAALQAVVPGLLYGFLGVLFVLVSYGREAGSFFLGGKSLLVSILLVITLLPALRRMLQMNITWKLGDVSFTKLLAVLNLPTEEGNEKEMFSFKGGAVEFKNVSFKYVSEKKSLVRRLSFSASPRAITLVKGGVGVGKTTLIKLITGLYHPQKGTVLVDGQRVGRLDPKSLRKHIAVVSDEWPLFGKTVFEAISYSRKPGKHALAGVVLEEVQRGVSRKKRVGLDEMIGDLGSGLSRGQRKLLMYARAFLTDKPILLVDEPFAGLDLRSQKHVAQLLAVAAKEKTVVLFNAVALGPLLTPDATVELGARSEKREKKKQARRKTAG